MYYCTTTTKIYSKRGNSSICILHSTGCSEAKCLFLHGFKWQKNQIYIRKLNDIIIKTPHHFILHHQMRSADSFNCQIWPLCHCYEIYSDDVFCFIIIPRVHLYHLFRFKLIFWKPNEDFWRKMSTFENLKFFFKIQFFDSKQNGEALW